MPTYHVNTNTVDDFGPGNEVLYVPIWANGDASNPDCRTGVVYSIGSKYVFVQLYDKDGHIQEPIPMEPIDLINLSVRLKNE